MTWWTHLDLLKGLGAPRPRRIWFSRTLTTLSVRASLLVLSRIIESPMNLWSLPFGIIWSTMPASKATLDVSLLHPTHIDREVSKVVSRGRNCVPRAPGIIPIRTSGNWKWLPSEQILWIENEDVIGLVNYKFTYLVQNIDGWPLFHQHRCEFHVALTSDA